MNQNPERILNNLKSRVVLTTAEKDAVRANLRAVMDMRPVVEKPVRSPFVFLPSIRYAFGFLLVFGMLGTGTALAENARPGDALYAVKVKVNEPVQLAVTLDAQKKAALRVSFVEERLVELAQLAATDTTDGGDLVAESLATHIADTQEDVLALHAEGESGVAYQLARDLSGVISSHTAILAAIDTDPETTRALVVEQNENAAIEETIASTLTEEELADSIEDAQTGALTSLEELRAELSTQTTLEADDLSAIAKRISEAEVSVASAKTLDASGADQEALHLYASAEGVAQSITDLLEAERTLNIDLIEE